MEPLWLGVLYVLPLVIWVLFVGVLVAVIAARALEDSLGYLLILRRRRLELVGLLIVLAGSQILKDAFQVLWGLGFLPEVEELLIAVGLNLVSTAAVLGLGWVILRRRVLTPQESRLLDTVGASMLAVGGRSLEVADPPLGRTVH